MQCITLIHAQALDRLKGLKLVRVKLENSDFDHLDKIGPSYKGLKDKNKTYHGTLWYCVKVIHKKQKI